jgi:carbon monoxide dehydrogenase subunit G
VLSFQGEQDFPLPPAEVWAKLSDLPFVVQCIPDVQAAHHPEPGVAVLTVRPGVSFVRGTLTVTLRLLEAVAGQSIKLHGHGKGIGSSNDVEVALTLLPHAAGTRVAWTAAVTQLGGLLKAVPRGLIQASAQKAIEDVWREVRQRLTAR